MILCVRRQQIQTQLLQHLQNIKAQQCILLYGLFFGQSKDIKLLQVLMDKKVASGATRRFDVNPCPSENMSLLITHRDGQARTADPVGGGVPAVPTTTALVRLRNTTGKPGHGCPCIPDTEQIFEGLLGRTLQICWQESRSFQWDCKGRDGANMS